VTGQHQRKYLDRARTGRIYFHIKGGRIGLPDNEQSPEFAAAKDSRNTQ
jgi:hypothetical protein